MKNKIIWITPYVFMDNNRYVVPYVSKQFDIHWIIMASVMPSNSQEILNLKSSSLEIEYYIDNVKWYSPLTFFHKKKFFQYVMSLGGDLIYYNNAPQLWEYYAARLVLPKEKIVFALHNAKIPKGARHESLARYYMNKVINNYTNFQVFSKNQKEYLESVSTGKNILMAQLPLINFGNKQERTEHLDKINFLAFGYIRRYKRFDLLIDAAQLLYEETKQTFVVTIVGKCNDWSEYQNRIKYPQLFKLYISFVEDNQVPYYFSNCDYLVQPYQDLAQSGPLMLAFYYNVPVISSDIPSFKEFIEEGSNGYMFKSEDVESLKNVMKKLLQQEKADRDNMLNIMENYIKSNYSLDSLAEKYYNYFIQF